MCHMSHIMSGPIVEDSVFIHKIDHIFFVGEILNLKWHPNHICGSKVAAILLNEWILSIGGATAVEGLQSMPGLPRLVLKDLSLDHMNFKGLYIIISHIFFFYF